MKYFLFFTMAVFLLSLKTSSQGSYNKFDSITIKSDCYWKRYVEEKKEPVVIRIRCLSSVSNDKPLFVIDGVIVEESELKSLDPNDIESIWILKNGEATALYGCRAAPGVVLITTKSANQRTIVVKDMLTGEPLTGANVDLVLTEKRNETIHLISDSLGRIVTNKIVYGKEYELKISSVGYKSFRVIANTKQLGKNYTVLLERQYDQINIQEKLVLKNLKLYPNPVMKSQKINIEFEGKQGKVTVRLFSIDHKLINAKEYEALSGMNMISFSIDASLSSGMYIIQLFDEKNYQLKTERLIIL